MELAARLGRLQQQRGGEFRPVEMPVEGLAFAIGEDVHPRQRIAHGEQRLLVHRRREEDGELRPFVDPERDALRNLVAAHGVVDRLDAVQGRMIGRQPGDVLLEIDIVRPTVGEGERVHHRLDLGERALDGGRPDEAFEIEHAGMGQIRAAPVDQRLPFG